MSERVHVQEGCGEEGREERSTAKKKGGAGGGKSTRMYCGLKRRKEGRGVVAMDHQGMTVVLFLRSMVPVKGL